ncbi:hypothetical protein D3C78_1415530 [compost metagenome]
MKLINPAFTQTKRGGGQSQQTHLGIDRLQVRENLLILAVIVIADAMALINNQQREFAAEQIKISRHRLDAAKNHFAVALFTLESGGENIRLQT